MQTKITVQPIIPEEQPQLKIGRLYSTKDGDVYMFSHVDVGKYNFIGMDGIRWAYHPEPLETITEKYGNAFSPFHGTVTLETEE